MADSCCKASGFYGDHGKAVKDPVEDKPTINALLTAAPIEYTYKASSLAC